MRARADFFSLQIVGGIINELDPIGLLRQGAPSDEYDEEIKKITSLIKQYNDVVELGNAIYDIFVDSVGKETAGDIRAYVKIAEKILARIRNK